MRYAAVCVGLATLLGLAGRIVALEAVTTAPGTAEQREGLEKRAKARRDNLDVRKRLLQTQLSNVELRLRSAQDDTRAGMQAQKAVLEEELKEVEREAARDLKPLVFYPSVQLNSSANGNAFQPVLEATGTIGDPRKDLWGSVKIGLKPVPPSNDTTTVADTIRIDTGTLSVNAGATWSHVFKKWEDDDGPLGFEARGAFQFSYQRATFTTAAGSGSAAAEPGSATDFGIITPEVRVGLWLKYAFLGYKYSYNRTFGQSSAVAGELDGTSTHKAIVIVKMEPLSGKEKEAPFYVECQYTGGKNSFRGGTFTFAVAKAFNAQW